MTAQYFSVFTEQGLALLRESIQNGTKLGITKMSFGDGNGTLPVPNQNYTSLINEVYETQLNSLAPDPNNANWLRAEAVIASAAGGFNIRELGLWAGDILVAYSNYPPTYKPNPADGTARIMTFRMVLQIDNTANFELKIDADIVMATIRTVEEAKNEAKIYADNTKISICSDYQDLLQLEKVDGRLVRTLQYYSNHSQSNGGATYRCENGEWILQPDGLIISPEQFGAFGDGITDDSDALQKCANFAINNNLRIVGESNIGYYITKPVTFFTETDIAGFVFPANETTAPSIYIESKKSTTTIPLSSLGGLVEGSSKITGFPDQAIGKYIRLTSNTDILTERYNLPGNTPYYKNTTFYLLDSDGNISPELDMSFSHEFDLDVTVEIIEPEKEIEFKVGEIKTLGSGSFSRGQIIVKRDSTHLKIGQVDSSSQFRTLITVIGNNCKLYGSAKDAQYDGYGYGISIGNCCDTFLYDFKATKCRTELDGRHGSNVFVFNSKFKKVGSHWGNNYKFENCEITDIAWAGRSISLVDIVLHGFFYLRQDVSYSSGTLYVRNLKLKSNIGFTLSGAATANFFTKPRKFFDVIDIDGVSCDKNVTTFFGFGVTPQYNLTAHRKVSIKNIDAPYSDLMLINPFPLDNAEPFPESYSLSLKDIKTRGYLKFSGRGFKNRVSQYGYKVRIENCGRLAIHADSSYIEELEAIDTTIISHRKINVLTPLGSGEYIYKSCKLKHDSTVSVYLFDHEAKKGFLNCEYQGVFSNTGGPILFSIGCRAKIDASGYPLPLNHYVNPTFFKTE